MDMFLQTERTDPDGIAVIDGGRDSHISVSRRELVRRIACLKRDLEARGIDAGDCIALWLPNGSDIVVWQFAAFSLGAHVIGINTRYNVDEIANVLMRAQPKVLAIAYDFAGLDLLGRLRKWVAPPQVRIPTIAVVHGPGGRLPSEVEIAAHDLGGGSWNPRFRAAATLERLFDRGDPNGLAVAFTTSGSTGLPKLAAHSDVGIATHAWACIEAGDWRQGDVTLCALPLTGVFSFIPAMATLMACGTCLMEARFDPDRIVVDMARFGVTHVIGADDIVGRIAESWRANPVAIGRWRRLLIADFNGHSHELAAWAEDQFGVIASGVYGSSELLSLAALWPHTTPSPQRWTGGGRLVSPSYVARCVEPETGAVCPPGDAGELQFRGPNVVVDYLGQPELLERQCTADGWFRSGDLGSVHADGSISYRCRIGDALRLKGFLVEPAEIESRLVEHPAVDIAKVVGVQLVGGATEAVAFVTARANASITTDDLLAWCRDGLARFKVPRTIHVLDAMPTTTGTNGAKIRSAELRAWAARFESNGERSWAAGDNSVALGIHADKSGPGL